MANCWSSLACFRWLKADTSFSFQAWMKFCDGIGANAFNLYLFFWSVKKPSLLSFLVPACGGAILPDLAITL
jgi:hypothetical protein